MIKAVIFDMDGVLIDTEPLSDFYYYEVLKKKGVTVTIEDFEVLRGANHKTFWVYFSEKYNIPHPSEEEKHQMRREYITFLKTKKPEPFPGLVKLLEGLKKKGIKLAIGSSASKYRIGEQVKILKLTKYFKTIVSGEEVKHGKPHPEIYLKAAEKLGVDPENCVAVEDAKNGVESAKGAGMKVLGFKPDSNSQDVSKADMVVKKFESVTVESILRL